MLKEALMLGYLKKVIIFISLLILLPLVWFKVIDWGEKQIKIWSEQSQPSDFLSQSTDAYAHIKVDGTNIDYSIAQHPTDDSYYLTHDVERHKSGYGWIFTERVNAKDFNDPIIIVYGHSTLDGAMFGSLMWFEDYNFFKANKKIQVRTKYEVIDYEIFSAYSSTNEHLFYTFQLDNKEYQAEYLKNIKKRAKSLNGYYENVQLTDKDKILILSTCDTKDNERRFIVHAKEKARRKN